MKLIGARIVALSHGRRVAVRTHVVPVVLSTSPVELVAMLGYDARTEREPALAAISRRPSVPGNQQRLHASARQLDQILLKRRYAECVANIEVVNAAVRALGLHDVAITATKEGRGHTSVAERGAVEPA